MYCYYLILTFYLCDVLLVALGNDSPSIGSIILSLRDNDVTLRTRSLLSAGRVRRKRFDCDCGEGSTNCFDYDGKIGCHCHDNRSVIGGTCSDCKCHNGMCDIEKDTCECWPGYGLVKGRNNMEHTCEKCDCGNERIPCQFVDGMKHCDCPGKFIGVNVTCTGCSCKEDEICLEKADHRSTCNCSNPAENCERCNCLDDTDCVSPESTKICECPPGKANLDGNCVECVCKENAKCSFINGAKTCSCIDGFEENGDGNCERCFCGDGHYCSFENGASVCTCKENYVEHNGICKNCTCNEGERCEFVDGKAKCLPKEISDLLFGSSCPGCSPPEEYSDDDGFGSGEGSEDDSFCKVVDGKKMCLCPENFADNGGTCESIQGSHASSTSGFLFLESCDPDMCFKGTCENEDGISYCKCDEGFTGLHCDIEIMMTSGIILLIALLSAVTGFWITLITIYLIRRKMRYRKLKQSQEPFNQRSNMISLNNLESRGR